MSWWRWTCSERGACSFNLPRPSSLWAEDTFFLSVYTFFWGLFSSPTLFDATGQQTTNLFMISFLSRTIDFFFLSLWIYLWLAGTSQQPISQTTWLKVTPHCNHFLGFDVLPCMPPPRQGLQAAWWIMLAHYPFKIESCVTIDPLTGITSAFQQVVDATAKRKSPVEHMCVRARSSDELQWHPMSCLWVRGGQAPIVPH